MPSSFRSARPGLCRPGCRGASGRSNKSRGRAIISMTKTHRPQPENSIRTCALDSFVLAVCGPGARALASVAGESLAARCTTRSVAPVPQCHFWATARCGRGRQHEQSGLPPGLAVVRLGVVCRRGPSASAASSWFVRPDLHGLLVRTVRGHGLPGVVHPVRPDPPDAGSGSGGGQLIGPVRDRAPALSSPHPRTVGGAVALPGRIPGGGKGDSSSDRKLRPQSNSLAGAVRRVGARPV